MWEYRWDEGTVLHEHWVTGVEATPDGWAHHGYYDFDDIFFWDYRPKPGDVIFDIGAGYGSEVLTFAPLVGTSGRVYCFEAHPKMYDRLVRLCDVNEWSNVETIHGAVADHSGTLTITDDLVSELNDVFRGGDVQVPAITLDEYVVANSIDRIDYLKMNIEGAERLAIVGMEKVAAITRHMEISCHDFLYERDPGPATRHARTRDEIRDWLIDRGFVVRDRHDDSRDWVRYHLYASHD